MCVVLLAGAVEGFCNKLRSILHGRPRGEKGEKAALKDVIVETGIDILVVQSCYVVPTMEQLGLNKCEYMLEIQK